MKNVSGNCLQQWEIGNFYILFNILYYLIEISLFFYIFRFTDDDVDEMYREAPIKGSMFDYIEFTRILKHGAKDKDEQ